MLETFFELAALRVLDQLHFEGRPTLIGLPLLASHFSPLPVVVRQIAVLTDAVRVVGTVGVRALVRQLVAPHHVVAVLAHALRVEGLVGVRAFRHSLFATQLCDLLLRLFVESSSSPLPS